MEDGFGLVVVMILDYTTGFFSYKDRRYFLEAPVLEEDWGGAWVKYGCYYHPVCLLTGGSQSRVNDYVTQ